MSKGLCFGLLASALIACGQGPAHDTQAPTAPAPVIAESPAQVSDAAIASAADAGPVTAIAPEATADAEVPTARAELTPSKSWPFFTWDRAQAYTFNLRSPGPGANLRVFSESEGWNKERIPGPILTAVQARLAMSLIAKTQGQMIVSKCPFPRHGIVFFQGEVPVASISVCFECGDIMIWPAYDPAPDWEDKKSRRFGKLMKSYDRVFPRWQGLFEKQLGLASDWKKLPVPPTTR